MLYFKTEYMTTSQVQQLTWFKGNKNLLSFRFFLLFHGIDNSGQHKYEENDDENQHSERNSPSLNELWLVQEKQAA